MILSRFTVNTTVGLAGFFDVATARSICPRIKRTSGRRAGQMGPPARALSRPSVHGPSDVRDTVGRRRSDGYLGVAHASRRRTDPDRVDAAIDAVNRRALALQQVESLRSASLDLVRGRS